VSWDVEFPRHPGYGESESRRTGKGDDADDARGSEADPAEDFACSHGRFIEAAFSSGHAIGQRWPFSR
jgi:hypothetical protein